MLNVGDKLICKTEGQPETECKTSEHQSAEGCISLSALWVLRRHFRSVCILYGDCPRGGP